MIAKEAVEKVHVHLTAPIMVGTIFKILARPEARLESN